MPQRCVGVSDNLEEVKLWKIQQNVLSHPRPRPRSALPIYTELILAGLPKRKCVRAATDRYGDVWNVSNRQHYNYYYQAEARLQEDARQIDRHLEFMKRLYR